MISRTFSTEKFLSDSETAINRGALRKIRSAICLWSLFVAIAPLANAERLVTLDVTNAPLSGVADVLAEVGGVNILVAPGSDIPVSLKADSIPLAKALDSLAADNNLQMTRNGSVIIVSSSAEAAVFAGFAKKNFEGKLVSLDLREAELRAVFKTLEHIGRKRFSVDEKISGTITIRLIDVPWEQALDVVARLKGLKVANEHDGVAVNPL
jgi:type II secretory pathway component HofQ